MPFSIKQQQYFIQATHRWNIKTGATRSGKTYMDYFVIPKRIRAVTGKDGLIMIMGNTKGTLQRNIIEPLQKIWTPSLVSDIKSDNTAMMFGERVFCIGADKVNQVNRVRGSSFAYCYGDEVATWHKDVFDMIKSRLDKPYSRFDGTCNPEGPRHWFKQFLDSDADIYQQDYTIYDNPFLSSDFVQNLEKEYTGSVYYDRFILGKWKPAEGLIYPDQANGENIVPTEDREYTKWYISVDYGTMNPCSMGLWGKCGKIWYRVAENYYNGRKKQHLKTDEEHYISLEQLAADRPIIAVIVDPSAASFIECIRRHGKFSVRKANNSVLDGIRITASRLKSGVIKINDCCTGAIEEFSSYRWDEKSAEDKPIKENDHAMDDIRYFAYTILRFDERPNHSR